MISEPVGTLAEQLLERLTDAILQGELMPGSKISEPEIARRYGVSRGPLREALHRLQGRKLITRTANHGARVVQATPQALRELFVIREALEGVAAREATRNATSAELAELRACVARLKQELDGSEAPQPYVDGSADRDFHFIIARSSRNPMLVELLCSELYPLLRLFRGNLAMTDAGSPSVLEHRRLLSAMEERDADLAEILMRRHIAAACRRREAAISLLEAAVQ